MLARFAGGVVPPRRMHRHARHRFDGGLADRHRSDVEGRSRSCASRRPVGGVHVFWKAGSGCACRSLYGALSCGRRCLDRRLDWRDAESAIDDRCRGGLPRRTVDVRAEGSVVLAIHQASAVRLNRIGRVPWAPCVFWLRCDTVAPPSDSMMAPAARGSPDMRFRWQAHSHTQAARTDRVAQQHGDHHAVGGKSGVHQASLGRSGLCHGGSIGCAGRRYRALAHGH